MHDPHAIRLPNHPMGTDRSSVSDRTLFEAIVRSSQHIATALASGVDVTPASVLHLARAMSRIQAGIPAEEIQLLREHFDTLLLQIGSRQAVTHTALGQKGPSRPVRRTRWAS